MLLVDALIQKNKEIDWVIYPDRNHRLDVGSTKLHVYRKMTDFIRKNHNNFILNI